MFLKWSSLAAVASAVDMAGSESVNSIDDVSWEARTIGDVLSGPPGAPSPQYHRSLDSSNVNILSHMLGKVNKS